MYVNTRHMPKMILARKVYIHPSMPIKNDLKSDIESNMFRTLCIVGVFIM